MNHAFRIKNSAATTKAKAKASVSTLIQERRFQFGSKFSKGPAKRSQHANATCRNIVGCNMLRAFGHRVAMCCDMLGVVDSNLKMVKFEPTTPNMSQHGGQTHATCCAQQCCDMLRWHVAIVWPRLKT